MRPAVECAPGSSSLIDVLDRVLDKGTVIDESVRVSLIGVDLITIESRVVIGSIVVFLNHSEEPTRVVRTPRLVFGSATSSESARQQPEDASTPLTETEP